MAILVGIDEAGFGPLLGPLVVSATVFRVADADSPQDLWARLCGSVAREGDRGDRRLMIADSKKLFAGRKSLAPLERGVLVMLAAQGRRPATWLALLDCVSPGCKSQLRNYPWYDGTDFALPLDAQTGDIGTRSNPIRREAHAQGVEFVEASCEVFLEGAYNRLVEATRNKSRVLLDGVLRLIDRALRATDDPRVSIVVDRLGGREHYRQPLMMAFPDYAMQVVEETPERSAYRMTRQGRIVSVEFATGGEDRFLPTALSSMFSKYLRELFMHAFNAYWQTHAPDLAPTAGYYTDGQRFLRDIAPVLSRLDIDPRQLVRVR